MSRVLVTAVWKFSVYFQLKMLGCLKARYKWKHDEIIKTVFIDFLKTKGK